MNYPKIIVFGLGAGLLSSSAYPASIEKPNIILVLTDDVSPDMFSCYSPYTPKGIEHAGNTPNIDKLAENGVMFKTSYASAMSAASRVELVTGKYANTTGVYQNGMWVNERSNLFLEDHLSFGKILKDAGYATAIAGKWHEGAIRPYEELGGFEEYSIWSSESYMEACDNYVGWDGGMENETTVSRYWHPGIIQNGKVLYTEPDDFGPEVNANFLMDFMETSVMENKPFFAYWPTVAPHGTRLGVTTNPFRGEVGEMGASDSEEKAARFKSLVEYIDYLMGNIVQKVEDLGIAENTIIIFLSDNGTAVTAKTRGVERGCHIVNIISGAGVIERGASDELTDFTDIAPTLVELAGADLPVGYEFGGQSLVPFLSGETDSHRDWIYGYISTSQLLRTKNYLLEVVNPMLGLPEGRFLYTGENRFREGYVRAEDSSEHQEARTEMLEILKQFKPIKEDHPFWQTDKGITFYQDYTSPATMNKHLHNHQDWVFYNEGFSTLDSLDLQKYQVGFYLTDSKSGEGLGFGSFSFNDIEKELNDSSYVFFEDLILGNYSYSTIIDGYSNIIGENILINKDTIFTIAMEQILFPFSLDVSELESEKPIMGVGVNIYDEEHITDINGYAEFSMLHGTHLMSLSKTDYRSIDTIVNIPDEMSISLVMEKISATLKVQLKRNSTPINNALVKVGNDSLITNSLGMATFYELPLNIVYDIVAYRDDYNQVSFLFEHLKDTTLIIQVVKLGFADYEDNNEVVIYPNPVKDKLNIETKWSKSEARITDANGRLLMLESIQGNICEMDISSLEQGIYILHLNTGQNHKTFKLIKTIY
ncbi:MAG: sulfatase-like hydrolase/transferase [Bacteroidales bacterium]|nr:sulfatase-like hydrolase/transferase [Bacteroidales bacterium]